MSHHTIIVLGLLSPLLAAPLAAPTSIHAGVVANSNPVAATTRVDGDTTSTRVDSDATSTRAEGDATAFAKLGIQCPGDYKVVCGDDISPTTAGTDVAFGGCGGALTVTHTDVDRPVCGADRFQRDIQRVWTVTDPCGNTATCTQRIHVVRQVWSLDIKPTSCPNPINIGGGGGQVSVGILGTATQDVSRIDPTSVRIWREGCAAGPLAPNMVTFEDVGTPFSGSGCGCHTLGADGFMDLRLRFDKQDMIDVLNLSNVPNMTYTRLVVTARLNDGCEILATDCVRVQ